MLYTAYTTLNGPGGAIAYQLAFMGICLYVMPIYFIVLMIDLYKKHGKKWGWLGFLILCLIPFGYGHLFSEDWANKQWTRYYGANDDEENEDDYPTTSAPASINITQSNEVDCQKLCANKGENSTCFYQDNQCFQIHPDE